MTELQRLKLRLELIKKELSDLKNHIAENGDNGFDAACVESTGELIKDMELEIFWKEFANERAS